MGKYGIYKKSIKQIYDDLEHEEEQLFQIQDRKTYDKILKEMEKEINSFGYDFDEPFYLFEKDIQNNFKRIYFVIGKWRFGMCGIFVHDQCDDVYILCDTKEDDYSQDIHEKQINIFINILDKYRSSVIVSKKKYDDIRWKE